jgi:hypothetical protein
MSMRVALRAVAILIAIAALIDPVWTASRPPVREVIAIDLTAGVSDAVVAELQARAPRWQIVQRRISGHRLPCGTHERCVAIADGSIDADVPADAGALSMIAVRRSGSPNIAVRSAVVSPGHAAAAGAARVELVRTGPIVSTDLRILDGAAVVGAVTHRWSDAESVAIEVAWWPIAAGARTLHIEAVPVDGEVTTIDNAIDVGVAVGADRSRVLVFDARPSWISTFVRRALEDDPRFGVEYRARVAPAVSAGTPNGALDARVLEATSVVVVGGPDALTASDVALLDRYVSRRGGSLILLPEQRPSGPVTRFFGEGWMEQLMPAPQFIGPLRATEILRTDRAPLAAVVLGRSAALALSGVEGSASIVAVPTGHGRVIISGAMDAWRYRHLDNGAFDRFWRSLIAEAARAGDALQIAFPSRLAAPGQRMPFTLRHRALDDRSAIEARVSVRCGEAPSPSLRAGAPAPVRVWPSGALDEFTGEIAVGPAGQCGVEATAGDRTAAAFVAVAERPNRGVEPTLAKLERASRAAGGVAVTTGDPSTSLRAGEGEIAKALDDSTAESSQIVSVHPMRSAWWIIPFAGCLSLEWWLRRRGGLR